MWAQSFLRVLNIIKHLVKSFSRAVLNTARKSQEIAIVAGSLMLLLASTLLTEGIIRTLKLVGGGEMLLGRIVFGRRSPKKSCLSNRTVSRGETFHHSSTVPSMGGGTLHQGSQGKQVRLLCRFRTLCGFI